MPNWCENSLTITCKTEQDANELKDKLQGYEVDWYYDGYEQAELESDIMSDLLDNVYSPPNFKKYIQTHSTDLAFDNIIPIPMDVIAQGYSIAGYDWCTINWGTKWEPDVQFEQNGKELYYSFDTAWSPPEPIITQICNIEKYNKHIDTLIHDFYEGGVGLGGIITYTNGIINFDNDETHSLFYGKYQEDYDEV